MCQGYHSEWNYLHNLETQVIKAAQADRKAKRAMDKFWASHSLVGDLYRRTYEVRP